MKVTLSELRGAVRDVLTEAATVEQLPQKYKFLGQDTAQAFKNLVWKLAADVAQAKGDKSPNAVQDVAADVGMSMGAHADDLLSHLVGQGQPKKAPPPASKSSTQPGTPVAKRQAQ